MSQNAEKLLRFYRRHEMAYILENWHKIYNYVKIKNMLKIHTNDFEKF